MSCGNHQEHKTTIKPVSNFQNKGHELVYNMTQKVGDYDDLLQRKDVVYTYRYQKADGKTDVATEKYLFEGQLSYGAYDQHERTIPKLKGFIEQAYDGENFWLKHNQEVVTDEDLINQVAFNRPTNFYWFTMMQKLTDPALKYEYLGDKRIANQEYDVVKISFDLPEKKATDIYQVYINKRTGIIDQFLFTVADHNSTEIPNLMLLTYERVDGILIPAQRRYQKSDWDATISDKPWTKVYWSNIKFNNGLTQNDFKK